MMMRRRRALGRGADDLDTRRRRRHTSVRHVPLSPRSLIVVLLLLLLLVVVFCEEDEGKAVIAQSPRAAAIGRGRVRTKCLAPLPRLGLGMRGAREVTVPERKEQEERRVRERARERAQPCAMPVSLEPEPAPGTYERAMGARARVSG